MTNDSGQAGRESRADEIVEYVEAVRSALADLPPADRDELLEDLPAHLTEVAAEDPTPLTRRLGPPEVYAAELRAAAEPGGDGADGPAPGPTTARPGLFTRWRRRRDELWTGTGRWLRRLDHRTGPLLGYERVSEFGRLLIPGWWVLRGYLAAMIVVSVLDRHGQLGLLPRLGGSTLVGLVVLAGFVAGSVWLAHRTPGLPRWSQRLVHLGTALVVLIGVTVFLDIDADRRYGWDARPEPVSDPPRTVVRDRYEDVRDVYVIDEDGRLLTGVVLLDQRGRPLEIGWSECSAGTASPAPSDIRGPEGEPAVAYPRCPGDLPWWLSVSGTGAVPDTGTPGPTPDATPGPTGPATPTAGPASPSPTPGPGDDAGDDPTAAPEGNPGTGATPDPSPSTTG